MRPVDKGEAPKMVFTKYQDAEPFLEKKLGPYCSYCEFPIKHVPEIEHKEAKSKGGGLLEWDNLLLACEYCNTRKSARVKKGDKGNYLWPDEDDTFHVFDYTDDLPKLNEEYLRNKDKKYYERALNLYNLVGLGNRPSMNRKDRRFFYRNEVKNEAIVFKEAWTNIKAEEDRKLYLDALIIAAKEAGFFRFGCQYFIILKK